MFDVVNVLDDDDDARRAPQGVMLAGLKPIFESLWNKALSSSDPHQVTLVLTYFLTCYLAFAFYLIYFLQFFLAFYLVYLRRFLVVEVRRATL